MKNINLLSAAVLMTAVSSFAGSPAAPYQDSSIDARLNVSVKQDTDVVHFVRDNADPNVITKAYVIKHIDPYELRTFLRKIVQTRKVTDNNTNVEAVQYTDGRAVLLISAEDYRFKDTDKGQGFDTLVKILDQPGANAASGRLVYLYNPKYRSAADLSEMINQIGAYTHDAVMNNISGNDAVLPDNGLNLIFFKTVPFSRPIIEKALAEYDKPYPEVRAKVTVYELYAENDAQIGLDFQSWKNNEGIDFFSTSGRFMRNHNGTDLVRGMGWESIRYFRFNPKWNTKYIDFLTSKGKAKIVHSATVRLQHGKTAAIKKTTGVFVTKLDKIDAAQPGQQSGSTVETVAAPEFGFTMKLTPSVTEKATILNVDICNSSLIGYNSDGSPRIQNGAAVKTNFMIDNSGTKLMIGGLEKRDVVRVSGGVPILKDLPVIGWLFSTESESTKRSQLLVVAEILPLAAPAAVTEQLPAIRKELDKAGETNRFGFRQYLLDSDR